MKNASTRQSYFKAQSYGMGKKMLAKLSNNNKKSKKIQHMGQETYEAFLVDQEVHQEEDRHSPADDTTVMSQESGSSSSSASSSSLQVQHHSSFRNNNEIDFDQVAAVWIKGGNRGGRARNKGEGYGSSQTMRGKFVFEGVYA